MLNSPDNARRPIAALRTGRRPKRAASARHAATLLIVIACTTIVMALLASALKAVVLEHRQGRQHERQAQTQWLARSALDRAAARLAADASYRGETWNPLAPDAAGSGAEVVIRVEPIASQSNGRLIHVQAVYRADAARTRVSKQIKISTSAGGAS